MLKIGIVGICGRMGHALWDCCLGLDGVKVICGLDRDAAAVPMGCNVPVVTKLEDLQVKPDVLVDFTRPDCSLKTVAYAAKHGISLVLGTTGFDEAGKQAIKDASAKIPLVFAANFSVGVNILLSLMQQTAAVMQDADIEIVEAHHRYKVDAPSGTALAMGEAAARGRGVKLQDVMVCGRNGITGPRQYGTIGFSSVRGGDIVGEHKAMFCCDGEIVSLGHHASSRMTFARGALRAAQWLEGKEPGMYSMKDVLGL